MRSQQLRLEAAVSTEQVSACMALLPHCSCWASLVASRILQGATNALSAARQQAPHRTAPHRTAPHRTAPPSEVNVVCAE
jgi:hypothetical protein